MGSAVRIREGAPSDTPAVLELFDAAVARDGPDASGRFARREARVALAAEWAAGGGLRIAESENGKVVGVLVLGARPVWVKPAERPERYIEALFKSERETVGDALVARAVEEARAAGAGLVRVDCWGGAPPRVAWYEAHGFQPSGTYDLDDWHGRVLSLEV